MRQQTVATLSVIVIVAVTGVIVVTVVSVVADVTVIAILDADKDFIMYPCLRPSNLCSSVSRKPVNGRHLPRIALGDMFSIRV